MEERTRLCLEHLETVYHLPGDVIELGVCEGFTAVPLASWLIEHAPEKVYYACDWWQGLPADAIGDQDGDLQAGECPWDFFRFQADAEHLHLIFRTSRRQYSGIRRPVLGDGFRYAQGQ